MSAKPPIIEDTTRLAVALDAWIEKPGSVLRHLSFDSGVPERTIYAIRKGRGAELQTIDRLCLAMELPLADVLPIDHAIVEHTEGWCRTCREVVGINATARCPWCDTDVVPGRKRGRRTTGLTHMSEDTLTFAYRLYCSGRSLRQVAAVIFPRTTYASTQSCANSLFDAFRTRGWKTRSRTEVLRARNFKHGRAKPIAKGEPGWEDYSAYRKELRRASGRNPAIPCEGTSRNGEPCKMFATPGTTTCSKHAPGAADRLREQCARMRERAAANQTTWSTISEDVDAAIERHGRPALTRQSGIDPSVMGRMLRYPPDQVIRISTCERLRASIARLDTEQEATR